MGSSAIDLEKHGLALLAAKGDVVSGRAAASWALFAYEKANNLRLMDSGGSLLWAGVAVAAQRGLLRQAWVLVAKQGRSSALKSRVPSLFSVSFCLLLGSSGSPNRPGEVTARAGGPDELAKRFQSGSIMYGLCRLLDGATGQQHVILINWVGEKVSDQRRQACAGHLPAIRAFFKEANLVVKASRPEEVTQEALRRMLSLAASPGGALIKKGPFRDPEELVGTNYKKTNPALEILHTKRSSFWAQAEKEEEERREEERRRAQEDRRRWERQRMEDERRQAAERERRIQEKERLIQEQKKLQAQQEAEERRNEEARRQQQWQRAKAPSEAGAQSPTSSERAATREASALVSPRLHSPRDFFQQRERSGSALEQPSSPGGQPGAPRRPFLRYQRSLTESAYIFRRPDPPLSPSPGGFLPSGSPPGAAAPLPSPRRPKSPPPVSPKPGPGAPSPILSPERKAPSTPTAILPETGALLHPIVMAMGSRPTAAAAAAAGATMSSLAGATPGGGGVFPPSAPPPELDPHSPFAGTGGPPPSSSSPPPSSLPQTRSVIPLHPLADSAKTEPVPPGEAAVSHPPLGACPREALPHTGTPGPCPWSREHWGEPSQAEGEGGQSRSSPVASPPTNGFPQEKGPATDDPPAPAPRQAELAPSSGHKGMGAVEQGKQPRTHEVDTGCQVGSPVGTDLPPVALGGLQAEEGTQNGDQPSSVERRGDARDPGLQVAKA